MAAAREAGLQSIYKTVADLMRPNTRSKNCCSPTHSGSCSQMS